MCSTEKLRYLSKIVHIPCTPIEMFKRIINELENPFILMNLATIDKNFGVLNRSVVYRGLSEEDDPGHIRFVTEKNSHKYRNLKEDPKVAVTIIINLPEGLWQVRVFNAEACELQGETLKKLWKEEPLFAKIRSAICKCGRPNNGVEDLECQYQEINKQVEKEGKEPEQTESYTAFKIIPKHWDFYLSEPNKIADRVQYKLKANETNKWDIYHVDA